MPMANTEGLRRIQRVALEGPQRDASLGVFGSAQAIDVCHRCLPSAYSEILVKETAAAEEFLRRQCWTPSVSIAVGQVPTSLPPTTDEPSMAPSHTPTEMPTATPTKTPTEQVSNASSNVPCSIP